MDYPINADESLPPEHRAARQRTDEEAAALWFTEASEVDWERLDRKDDDR